MKLKVVLFLFVFLFSTLTVHATEQNYGSYLSKVEESLYSTTFSSEKTNIRLNRIEKSIYGETYNEPIPKRILRLNQIYNYTPQQKVKTNNIIHKSVKQAKQLPAKVQKPVDLNSYPIVDMMESKIFNKTFKADDIYKRIQRLELAVFKRNFDGDIGSRVDRLKMTVIGNINYNNDDESYQTQTPQQGMDKNSINTILNKLEADTFKESYPNDSTETRLDRLETKIFNQTSPEDSTDSRIERLTAVIAAQPTSSLYKDMSQLNKYQTFNNRLTVATMLLLLLSGLLF